MSPCHCLGIPGTNPSRQGILHRLYHMAQAGSPQVGSGGSSWKNSEREQGQTPAGDRAQEVPAHPWPSFCLFTTGGWAASGLHIHSHLSSLHTCCHHHHGQAQAHSCLLSAVCTVLPGPRPTTQLPQPPPGRPRHLHANKSQVNLSSSPSLILADVSDPPISPPHPRRDARPLDQIGDDQIPAHSPSVL